MQREPYEVTDRWRMCPECEAYMQIC